MDHPKLLIEVTSLGGLALKTDIPSEWSEGSRTLGLEGEIVNLKIKKDGKPAIGIVVKPDGSLILSFYEGGYTQDLTRQLHLNNERPWNEQTKS